MLFLESLILVLSMMINVLKYNKGENIVKKIEENLEKNKKLSHEFKELARKSFQEMFEMLEKEGFKKWIKMKNISKDVKDLIYEWADMNNTRRAGEYSDYKNRIRIDKNLTSRKKILGISKHEAFHFFTRCSN